MKFMELFKALESMHNLKLVSLSDFNTRGMNINIYLCNYLKINKKLIAKTCFVSLPTK